MTKGTTLLLLAVAISLVAAQTAAWAGYKATVLGDNPLAYWRLEEAGPSVAMDSSPNMNDAQIRGTFSYGAVGAITSETSNFALTKTGGAVNEVRIPGTAIKDLWVPNSNPFSIEVWAKTTGTSGFIVAWYSDYYAFFLLTVQSDGKVKWDVRDSDAVNRVSVVSNKTINDGVWHHFVGVVNLPNNVIKLYIDGQLDAFDNSAYLGPIAGSARFEFGGCWPLDPTQPFDGSLDDIAVYTSEIGSSRVLAHYQAATTGGFPSVSFTDAKKLADNSPVNCQGIVTARSADFFYIETPDRTSGIRIVQAGCTISVGHKAVVSGYVGTVADSVERCINAVEVIDAGPVVP